MGLSDLNQVDALAVTNEPCNSLQLLIQLTWFINNDF